MVPLKDLVKHNAVNETPKTQAVQQTGHLRRRLTNHPRCVRAATGHGGTVPSYALDQTRREERERNLLWADLGCTSASALGMWLRDEAEEVRFPGQ